jgi:hypothetical protein
MLSVLLLLLLLLLLLARAASKCLHYVAANMSW